MWKKKNLDSKNSAAPVPAESAEAKNEEINESLVEIYEGDNGEMVDVKKFDIKKGHGAVFWSVVLISALAISSLAGWLYYDYVKKAPANEHFNLVITPSKDMVMAGEEVEIVLSYKNLEKVDIKALGIRAVFPENFVVLSSNPEAVSASSTKNYLWKTESLGPNGSGEIRVRGKIFSKAGDKSSIYAEAAYVPDNFSSEFKKTAVFEIAVAGIGIDFNFDNFSSALIGEENTINVNFKKQDENYLDNFTMALNSQNGNLEIVSGPSLLSWIKVSSTSPNEWRVGELSSEERQFPVKFKITQKKADTDQLTAVISTEYGGIKYPIFEKQFSFDVIKGDLSLNLIINGSKNDQGVNLGDDLNYLLSFSNKGETTLKDVVIMAVIDGGAIDWAGLSDQNKGKVSGNTISWSKNEIPQLESVAPGSEGSIEFKLKVKDRIGASSSAEIKNYARYNVSGSQGEKDNVSNTIINKVNSQLNFTEKIQYFNDDNLPVGTGPTPPKAGEATTYKTTWAIGGNIHELSGTKVEMALPDGVSYAGKSYSNVGQIEYNDAERKITWNVGRLPVLSQDLTAEFSIGVSPVESDKNKIMVLSAGSVASGLDSETNSSVSGTSKAKTTKLEDDEIGASDGVVR
ncbi:MAG: hypothetical protein WCW77_02315 [Patescibacteria group bacterium]|jgi:uncharacterized repeat protein (TIGR01451 family)